MIVPFYKNSLATTFIRSLVSSTPLPIYPVVRDGDYIHENLCYIYKFRVIKCAKSGILNTTISTLQIDYYYTSEQLQGDPFNRYASFYVMAYYDFGKYYTNITEKVNLPNSFYDYKTHRYLGKYLECLRALYNIDLFSMYNCYNSQEFDDIYINPKITGNYDKDYLTIDYPIILKQSSEYKILAFPIKYNTKYTIYMETNSEVFLMPILKSDAGYIQLLHSNIKTAKSYHDRTFHPIRLSSLQFKKPYVFEGVSTHEQTQLHGDDLYNYEQYLYLMIQVDKNVQSSLVVLQGDTVNLRDPLDNLIYYEEEDPTSETGYHTTAEIRKLSKYSIINGDDTMPALHDDGKHISKFENLSDFLNHLPKNELEMLYRPSNNSLLLCNDKQIYAFNDKLLLYLLHHVITNREWIEGNIKFIQDILPTDRYYEDVWDIKLRQDIYNKLTENRENVTYFDELGYYDTCAEKYLQQNKDRILR